MPDPTPPVLAAASTTVDQFAMGYWLAALSFGVSALGAVVGLACILHAARSARFRLVWVVAAAVSVGGVGIWLAMAVALLGLQVPGSVLRYDAGKLITALVIAFVAVCAALLLIGRTRRLPWLIGGSIVLGAGAGATIYLGVGSVRVQGSVQLTPWLIGISIAVAVVTALGTLWSFQTFRTPLIRAATILLFAAGMAASYYVAVAAMRFDVDRALQAPSGLTLFDFVFPMFVIGSLALAVPISAVLIAPDRSTLVAELEPARRPGLEPAR